MHAIEPITKNGPNGIYSSLLFKIKTLISKTKIETMAPTKNANNETCAMPLTPKYKPIAPMNFTSPSPIASLPAMIPPSNVIAPKIPAPVTIPK